LRIECFDMAHLQGTDYVGSMVVLEDGLPAKREYRRFKVNGVGGDEVGSGSDDYAAMAEVVRRRLQAYLDDRDRPVDERAGPVDEDVPSKQRERKPGKFAYPPQLLLVDGGKGQVSATQRVVDELGLRDEIPVAGLAKRFEEIYVPGRSEPVEIPRGSEALFMLQRIRDEAHRFANSFHGERRSKRMTVSALDGIPGLGESRKKKLVTAMGGVNAVKRASLDELKVHSFLPDAVAEAIHAKFHD
jgi:excinuclease ABC subunit C